MATKPCPSCGNQISPQASACPQCGHPLKTGPSGVDKIGGAIIVIIVAWIGVQFLSGKPDVPDEFQNISREAIAYLKDTAGGDPHLSNGHYCKAKAVEKELYILCGLPNEGWGALFHLAALPSGKYALQTMNGPAIMMADNYHLVASKSGLGDLPGASDILSAFGSAPAKQPAKDPGPSAPVPLTN